MSGLVDDIADIGSEEDEDLDDETGEAKPRTNGRGPALDDSSEEEDDDEDEEAAAAIRKDFIVDEDEDEDERKRRKRERRKRRRAEREEEDEVLDEEDLDLIGEANPEYERPEPTVRKFKRLKQGHKEDRSRVEPRGVKDIFSDEEDDVDDDVDDRGPRRGRRGLVDDEMEGFIEDDDMDDGERDILEEEREVARPGKQLFAGVADIQASGLDEASLEDMRAAFGDGTEYDWALHLQDLMLEEQGGVVDRPLELKDVFEPSQLADKMLTDDDNAIRQTDVPERFQLLRKPFKEVELTEEEAAARADEEAVWISNMLLPKKNLDREFREPFQKSVGRVLDFINVENYEIPFIFQHRKDYLIHASKVEVSPSPNDPNGSQSVVEAKRLLTQGDMWDILDLDMKFRALVEKRDALQKTYDNLKSISNVTDEILEEMLPEAVTMEEVQDIQDYLHFQYSAQLKDINVIEAETSGAQKRARAAKSVYEKMRASKVYNMVRAFGISADDFAQNALDTGRRHYAEDPTERPDDMADSLLDPPDYTTGSQVTKAARMMYAEELTLSPRMRKVMRRNFYMNGQCNCVRTEKGSKAITEDHPYYEFKYLRHQDFSSLARKPELYLRMLKAESEGLVQVSFQLDGHERFKQNLYRHIESDNFSEVADAWNVFRKETLDLALVKLERLIARGVKENMKAECEKELAKSCREKYLSKLDQASFKPKGLDTEPRVLTLSNGNGNVNRDATCWVFMDDDGRVLENGKFTDLRLANPDKYIPAGKDVEVLIELIKRRKPDVLAVAGFSVETRRLYKDLQEIVDKYELYGPDYEDEDGNDKTDKLDVIIVNDEVARLYQTSERAVQEHPSLAPLARYCVALARYIQDPMKEYAALGNDIISISFDTNQDLLPKDKLMKALESAMVDMVNLVGVDINEAVSDKSTANLLPYVCGLGQRKASQLVKVINLNNGMVQTRSELVGDPDRKLLPAVGAKVWENCASFLYIDHDPADPESDYLDNTRVYPEDYDLARKMAADALELDEEDVKAETDEGGASAVVRKLIKEDAQEKVNELVLEEYAEQLETQFHQRKRATLETIRAELITPYEELRREFLPLTTDEIFTMLTGETKDSLDDGMIVPMVIRRIFSDHIEGRLDCGIEVGVSEIEYPDGVGGERGIDPRQAFSQNQTVRGKVLYLNRKQLTAQLSLREDALRHPTRRPHEHLPSEWDAQQEADDRRASQKAKDDVSGRTQRVIKHPLFRPFNAAQAEEYLGSQGRGDVVIRPSSKGIDHLAVTWKVSDNIYQHIDVLELDKENPFSVGRTLKVGGKYSYTDLDELIANHVKAMAKKVDEMMLDERYQTGNKTQTEQWLTTYTEANPKRSMYAFCINPKYPGYFYLCFKAGLNAPLANWPVKIIPNAFELQRNPYPDMRTLKNGFKLLFQNSMNARRR